MKTAKVFTSLSCVLLLCLSYNLIQTEATATSTTLPRYSKNASLTTSTNAETPHPRTTNTTIKYNPSTVNTTTRNKLTSTKPNNTNTTHVPKVCQVSSLDNSSLNLEMKDNDLIKWLPSTAVLISQENKPLDLKCQYCLIEPITWTKILWYKDNKPIADGKILSHDTLHISNPNNNADEGVYKCTVVAPGNKTASQTTTIIINKDPGISIIPSIWVRNETSQSTLISWLVRGHGIFDSVKVTVKVRRLESPIWEYKRHYIQYISGSTQIQNLIPSTEYIVNITAVNENGVKEECRCMSFWSNAWNSTESYNNGIFSFDYSIRRILGLVFGVLGLLSTVAAVYCCVVYPTCELRNHQGYSLPTHQESSDKDQDENDSYTCNKTAKYPTTYPCKDSANLYTSNGQHQITIL